jgi:hypothetical protein
LAGIGIRCERLLPAVGEPLEFSTQAQAATHLRRNGCHGENIEWTGCDALFLAFTAIPVDDRPDNTGGLFAICFLNVQ